MSSYLGNSLGMRAWPTELRKEENDHIAINGALMCNLNQVKLFYQKKKINNKLGKTHLHVQPRRQIRYSLLIALMFTLRKKSIIKKKTLNPSHMFNQEKTQEMVCVQCLPMPKCIGHVKIQTLIHIFTCSVLLMDQIQSQPKNINLLSCKSKDYHNLCACQLLIDQ